MNGPVAPRAHGPIAKERAVLSDHTPRYPAISGTEQRDVPQAGAIAFNGPRYAHMDPVGLNGPTGLQQTQWAQCVRIGPMGPNVRTDGPWDPPLVPMGPSRRAFYLGLWSQVEEPVTFYLGPWAQVERPGPLYLGPWAQVGGPGTLYLGPWA